MVVIPPIKTVILGIEFPTSSVCSEAFKLMAVRIGARHAATMGNREPFAAPALVEMALDP